MLAELECVMVPGSVEEERAPCAPERNMMFSAMKWVPMKKSLQRNRLQEEHLTICARLFHHPRVKLATFDYGKAIKIWLAGAPERGRMGHRA